MDADDELVESIPAPEASVVKSSESEHTEGQRKRKLSDADDDLVAGIDKKGKVDDEGESSESDEEGEDVVVGHAAEFSGSEAENEYDMADGFMAADGESSDSDDDRPKEKREKVKFSRLKKNTNKVMLDDEDLMIVRENMEAVSSVSKESKQRKADVGGDARDDTGSEIAPEEGGEAVEDEEDANEFADFIVDEGGEGSDEEDAEADGAPKPVARRAASGIAPRKRFGAGPNPEELQESMDIFGIENLDLDDLDIDDEDEYGVDGEDAETLARNRDESKIANLRSKIERQVLVDNFYTDRDEEIRQADCPERYFDVMNGRTPPDDDERREEANWMTAKLTAQIYATTDPMVLQYQTMASVAASLAEPVHQVLLFIHVQLLEVPFIWAHRRDYLHPLITRDHLWQIVTWDEKWDTLYTQRSRLLRDIDGIFRATEYKSEQFNYEQERSRGEILTLTGLRTEQEKLLLNWTEAQNTALDNIDRAEDPDDDDVLIDREKVITLRKQIEEMTSELSKTRDMLNQKQKDQESQLELSLQLDKYTTAGIAEVKRCFPRERYDPIIEQCCDEQELKDIALFLGVLLKGALKDKAFAAAATPAAASAPASQASTSEAQHAGEGGEEKPAEGNPEDESADTFAAANMQTNGDANSSKRHTHFHDKVFQYTRYRKAAGVREMIEKIFVSACDMGDAVRNGISTDVPPTPAGGEYEYKELLESLIGDGTVIKSAEEAAKALTTVIGTELASEPSFKSATRRMYRGCTTISTEPTSKGILEITPFTELFGLHYLKRKPLQLFLEGPGRKTFIQLVQAEKDGLLVIKFQHPIVFNQEDGSSKIDITPYFSEVGNKWFPKDESRYDNYPQMREMLDLLRFDSFEMALIHNLIPTMEAEVRRDLMRLGKEAIVEEATENFTKMLQTGPYQPISMDPRDAIASLLTFCPYRPFYATVVSIHVQPGGREPMAMVYLDKEGVLCASDFLPSKAMAMKAETLERFIGLHKPDLVIINSSGGLVAKQTLGQLERITLPKIKDDHEKGRIAKKDSMGMDYNEDFDDMAGPYNPQAMIIKDDISEIFKLSSRASKMFPNFQQNVCASICLGRFVQEPLAEFCNLWTSANAAGVFGYEALFLKLHPLLNLTKNIRSQLLTSLERALVNAVCDIGVDINQSNQHEHLASMLAFVGGLGLRKANHLRATIRDKLKHVSSRAELLERRILKLNVWNNCASFIRVEDTDNGNGTSAEVNPFDNTRVHPECYHSHEWAPKICANAMDNEDWVEGQDYFEIVSEVKVDSRNRLERLVKDGVKAGGRSKAYLDMWMQGRPQLGVTTYRENVQTSAGLTEERVRQCELSDKLANLLIEEYCKALEEKGEGKHMLQFNDIKEELRFPWLDMRKSIEPPSPSEMFTIITGENDISMHVGLKIGCEVLELDEKMQFDSRTGESKARPRAFVKTDCGLKGIISMYEVADDRLDEATFSMHDYLQVGQRVLAVVVGVDKMRNSLDLSIKPMYMSVEEDWWISNRYTNRQCMRWFEQTKAVPCRDLNRLYDAYFQEQEALKIYRDSIQSEAMVVTPTAEVKPTKRVANQRHIIHPLFVNCGHNEAEERLSANMNTGAVKYEGNVIIRPSSKGPDSLSITWAFNLQKKWFMHFEVDERGKAPGSLQLGSQLHIKYMSIVEPFSDLDEIYIRFIDPMNDYANLMANYLHFRDEPVKEVESYLMEKYSNDNSTIPYCIRYQEDMPGIYVLTWLSPKSSVPIKMAKITLLPTGYHIEKKLFNRPAEIIDFLKEQVGRSNRSSAHAKAPSGDGARRTRFSNRN